MKVHKFVTKASHRVLYVKIARTLDDRAHYAPTLTKWIKNNWNSTWKTFCVCLLPVYVNADARCLYNRQTVNRSTLFIYSLRALSDMTLGARWKISRSIEKKQICFNFLVCHENRRRWTYFWALYSMLCRYYIVISIHFELSTIESSSDAKIVFSIDTVSQMGIHKASFILQLTVLTYVRVWQPSLEYRLTAHAHTHDEPCVNTHAHNIISGRLPWRWVMKSWIHYELIMYTMVSNSDRWREAKTKWARIHVFLLIFMSEKFRFVAEITTK